jgi:hypothetical protein
VTIVLAIIGVWLAGMAYISSGINAYTSTLLGSMAGGCGLLLSKRLFGNSETAKSNLDCVAIQRGSLVEIGRIIRVVPVDGLEDMGPGYILTTADGEDLFIAGQVIGAHDCDGEQLCESITLKISEESDILSMRCDGGKVDVSTSLVLPPPNEIKGFAILNRKDRCN